MILAEDQVDGCFLLMRVFQLPALDFRKDGVVQLSDGEA